VEGHVFADAAAVVVVVVVVVAVVAVVIQLVVEEVLLCALYRHYQIQGEEPLHCWTLLVEVPLDPTLYQYHHHHHY
jgi:hypothetical protein